MRIFVSLNLDRLILQIFLNNFHAFIELKTKSNAIILTKHEINPTSKVRKKYITLRKRNRTDKIYYQKFPIFLSCDMFVRNEAKKVNMSIKTVREFKWEPFDS